MKNPVRNIVVEYKNRRTRKSNSSLWGDIDLRSLARQVETETLQMPSEAGTDLPSTGLSDDQSATNQQQNPTQIVASPIRQSPSEPTIPIKDEPERETAATIPGPAQSLVIANNDQTTPRKKPVPQEAEPAIARKARPSAKLVSGTDNRDELDLLESENASLKRELIAKLRLENQDLFLMLQRVSIRTQK